MPFRDHADIEQSPVSGRGMNGVIKIEFITRPLTRKLTQFSQGDFYIAGAKFHLVVEIPEFPLVPYLHRTFMAGFVLADSYSLRVITVSAER